MRISRLLSILLLLPTLAMAQPEPGTTGQPAAKSRLKIGVALSGGGAKGAAHVGVLRMLEQYRIPVDYIAGTSMGAYVAGLYSLGHSADEIEALMASVDYSTGFVDDIPRENLDYRDKQNFDDYPVDTKMGYRDGELSFPRGVLAGQTMTSIVRRSVGTVPALDHFDNLPIPMRAVATDLTDRSEVVLDRGNLVQAMQASMTVPGALAPMEVNGRLLVDGGLANNLPIKLVRQMGADVVIAVDIGTPLKKQEELGTVFDVMDQLSGYLTNLSRDQQVAAMEPQDILLVPDITGVGTSDFELMPLMIDRGEMAAEEMSPRMTSLVVSEAEYQAYHQAKLARRDELLSVDPRLAGIRVLGDTKVSETTIRDALALPPGKRVDQADIEQAVDRVYALNVFEHVDAYLEEEGDQVVLALTVRDKSWGPDTFELGLHYEDNFDENLNFGIGLAFTRHNLWDKSTEWRTELDLGNDQRVMLELYQPLGESQLFYVRGQYEFEDKDWNVRTTNGFFPFERFNQKLHNVQFGMGLNLGRNAQLEIRYQFESGRHENEQSGVVDKIGDYDLQGLSLSLGYDTLNHPLFATSGQQWWLSAEYVDSDTDLGSDFGEILPVDLVEDNWVFQARWTGATSFGRHALIGKFDMETLNEDGLAIAHFTSIGGFLNLSGYSRDALVGSHKLLAGAVYTYDLGAKPLGFPLPVFLGFSAEAGNAWQLKDNVDTDDLIYAGSIFAAAETRLGPAAVAFGKADTGDTTFYLFLGKPF